MPLAEPTGGVPQGQVLTSSEVPSRARSSLVLSRAWSSLVPRLEAHVVCEPVDLGPLQVPPPVGEVAIHQAASELAVGIVAPIEPTGDPAGRVAVQQQSAEDP